MTADGAYHCPVGSIWLFFLPKSLPKASTGSVLLISWPTHESSADLHIALCSTYQVTVRSSLGVVKSFSFTGNPIWNIGQYMRSFIDILLQSRNRLKEMYHQTQNQPNGPHKDLSVSNQWIQNMVMILPHTPAHFYRLLPVLVLVLLLFGLYRYSIIHKR